MAQKNFFFAFERTSKSGRLFKILEWIPLKREELKEGSSSRVLLISSIENSLNEKLNEKIKFFDFNSIKPSNINLAELKLHLIEEKVVEKDSVSI
ncbi:hypothetical protein BpHYR1_024049 [Brachionus plicatilis]|uniref:Uncharacterized protein n=1 Tax=Brachionus plicatilis TaxID=10195 RepID=A0A3M7SI90_BRAPC|nr:hypothetical protein BpHYR1_024049 [Brachionus plicatilis]